MRYFNAKTHPSGGPKETTPTCKELPSSIVKGPPKYLKIKQRMNIVKVIFFNLIHTYRYHLYLNNRDKKWEKTLLIAISSNNREDNYRYTPVNT